jgi:hypothetical protein
MISPLTRFRWTSKKNPCPACAVLEGIVRTRGQWEMSVTPELHPNCRCTLDPVEVVEDDCIIVPILLNGWGPNPAPNPPEDEHTAPTPVPAPDAVTNHSGSLSQQPEHPGAVNPHARFPGVV